jgi:HEPN domain-containing protein
MKKLTAEWVRKAEGDFVAARKLLEIRPLLADQIGFHCQQTAEKYLKGLLHHLGLPIPRTHDIPRLVELLLPVDKTLRPLRRGTKTLSRYAADYRYPGLTITARQARAAFEKAVRFREEIRQRLGLRTRRTK